MKILRLGTIIFFIVITTQVNVTAMCSGAYECAWDLIKDRYHDYCVYEPASSGESSDESMEISGSLTGTSDFLKSVSFEELWSTYTTDKAFKLAVVHGYKDIVEIILKESDREQSLSCWAALAAFKFAVASKRADMLKLLLRYQNFKDKIQFLDAVTSNLIDVVEKGLGKASNNKCGKQS